jgi:hypothetical protein
MFCRTLRADSLGVRLKLNVRLPVMSFSQHPRIVSNKSQVPLIEIVRVVSKKKKIKSTT